MAASFYAKRLYVRKYGTKNVVSTGFSSMTRQQHQATKTTMPRKKLAHNAPCPCGSGKQYGDCCYDKGFEYLVDENGTIFKSIPMSGELAEVIEEQKRRFVEQHGREPGPGDNLFFDMPPFEHAEHFMVEAMKQAGLDPAIIYAFEKTGLLVTEENEHLISDKDRAEWEAAVLEYRAKHGDDAPEEYEEDEWF
jgi:hypothetical protein